MKDVPEFDHFTPAEWLVSHPDILSCEDAATSKTLKRFQLLFNRINGFLKVA